MRGRIFFLFDPDWHFKSQRGLANGSNSNLVARLRKHCRAISKLGSGEVTAWDLYIYDLWFTLWQVIKHGNWKSTINNYNTSWLVVWNLNFIFPFSWECYHPNWLSLIFFRGVAKNHQPASLINDLPSMFFGMWSYGAEHGVGGPESRTILRSSLMPSAGWRPSKDTTGGHGWQNIVI